MTPFFTKIKWAALFLGVSLLFSRGVLAANTAPSNGLVGYWAFDDASGTTAVDSSGNSNNGTVSNASWGPGKINDGLVFNGSNSLVSLPASNSLNLTNKFSV